VYIKDLYYVIEIRDTDLLMVYGYMRIHTSSHACRCAVHVFYPIFEINISYCDTMQNNLIPPKKSSKTTIDYSDFDLPKSEYSRVFSGSRRRNLQMRGLCLAG
jgi:hypothetical protein